METSTKGCMPQCQNLSALNNTSGAMLQNAFYVIGSSFDSTNVNCHFHAILLYIFFNVILILSPVTQSLQSRNTNLLHLRWKQTTGIKLQL
jgi:hypothetical protein